MDREIKRVENIIIDNFVYVFFKIILMMFIFIDVDRNIIVLNLIVVL